MISHSGDSCYTLLQFMYAIMRLGIIPKKAVCPFIGNSKINCDNCQAYVWGTNE
jgi:hypothetical protein